MPFCIDAYGKREFSHNTLKPCHLWVYQSLPGSAPFINANQALVVTWLGAVVMFREFMKGHIDKKLSNMELKMQLEMQDL